MLTLLFLSWAGGKLEHKLPVPQQTGGHTDGREQRGKEAEASESAIQSFSKALGEIP
jgi:hypothetical protein